MRSINATSRVPFVVSLTLIFGYGLLHVAVPPTEVGAGNLAPSVATTPDASPATERVAQVGHAGPPARDAEPSVQ